MGGVLMKHYNINEMFSTAKDSLDIKKCAEYYGMTIDRGGRAICPFHDDRHPSLSFKDGYFKCFACGEGGDVFKLVGRLTGIDKPIDVLRLLNRDFGLNLPLDEKISHEQAKLIREKAKEREHYKDLDKRFEEWTDRAFIACSRYTKLLRQWREEFAPSSPNEELNPLFEESLIRLDYMEYLTAELITADRKKMREIYMLNRKEIKWIERRIECYE
jgi:DNA primase